jgi:hypothetical protein
MADREPIGRHVREGRRRETHLVIAAAGCIGAAELGYALLDRGLLGDRSIVGMRGVHAFVCFAVALLLARPRPERVRGLVPWFLVVILPLLPIFWIVEDHVATLGIGWSPFVGHKYLLIPIALLSPRPLSVAASLIALFTGAAILQSLALGLSMRPLAAAGEPWPTILFGLIAFGLVWYRARSERIAREAAEARADSEAYERLATLVVALRDGTSTPLQTLALSIALLRANHPDEAELHDRMERAIEELRAINRTVARCDAAVRGAELDETAFDAHDTLERLQSAFRDRATGRRRRI